jgi:hypothetical protein
VDEVAGRAPGGPARGDPAQQSRAYAKRSSGDAGQLLLAGVRTPAAVRPSPRPGSVPALPAAPPARPAGRAARRRGPCRCATTRPPDHANARRSAGSAPGNRALDNGVTPAELGAIITHLAFYAGWPNALSAAGVAKNVFAKRGIGDDQLASGASEPLPVDESTEGAGYGCRENLWRGRSGPCAIHERHPVRRCLASS